MTQHTLPALLDVDHVVSVSLETFSVTPHGPLTCAHTFSSVIAVPSSCLFGRRWRLDCQRLSKTRRPGRSYRLFS
jgi:hypothetical protein